MKKGILRSIYCLAGGMALIAVILLSVLLITDNNSKNLNSKTEQEWLEQLESTEIKQEALIEDITQSNAEPVSDPVPEPEPAPEVNPEVGQEVESEIEMESAPFQGFKMTIIGDTYYNQRRVDQYLEYGIKGLLGEELIDLMLNADVAVLNNECALSDGGSPMPDKQYTYKMTPSLVQSYVDMGIDVVTLANNHALDFGTEALTDTFKTLDSYQIDYIGAGADLDRASQASVYEIDGKTLAILAASRVIPVVEWNVLNRQPGMFCTYDSTALEAEIRECSEIYDYVVVYVHWGVMETEQPQDYQRQMAYRYVDAGADVVFGTHPHVVQSIEFYDGKPIFYSLGNFLYGATIQKTMLAELEVDADGNLRSRIYPCYAENGRTLLMDSERGKDFYRYMENISWSVSIDDEGYVKESDDERSE